MCAEKRHKEQINKPNLAVREDAGNAARQTGLLRYHQHVNHSSSPPSPPNRKCGLEQEVCVANFQPLQLHQFSCSPLAHPCSS